MPSKKSAGGHFSHGSLRTVGITGGIGSGKSTVCRLLADHGYPVLSADALAIEIEETDPFAVKKIKSLLGTEAYFPDGTLNRHYVATRVFSNKKFRKSMESIVHPAVFRELRRRAVVLSNAGIRLAVIEAALIYESGMDAYVDFVVVVQADEAVRIARVMNRDGISADEVRKRISAQFPVERKARLADFVIGNNGTERELQVRVQLLRTIIEQLS